MLISVDRIWDQAAYSAFTDLCRHDGRWVCVFREGVAHAGDNGSARVLTSEDGQTWRSAAFLQEDGVDLRDPKVCVTPGGELMLLVGGAVYEPDDAIRRSMVSFSRDAETWTPWAQVVPDGHWLWRVTWHRGVAYGVSKLGDGDIPKRGFLWRSYNGVEYGVVDELDVPAMSETTLRFTEADEAVAFTRRTGPGGGNAWIGSSAPPYADWGWAETDQPVGGPNFLILPGGEMWATSRHYGAETRTGLFRMTRSGIELALTLPSGGDTSYAGMVWHDGLVWMSYYSSHEERPSIYLARVELPE
jgi:hypothetical protein